MKNKNFSKKFIKINDKIYKKINGINNIWFIKEKKIKIIYILKISLKEYLYFNDLIYHYLICNIKL